MKRRAYIYLFILVVVLIVSVVLYVKLNKETLTRIVSYYGSIASVFGILVTLVEVYHAERIARKTKDVVKEKIERLHRDEVLLKVAKAIDECVMVLELFSKNDYSNIVNRCRSLQDSLIVVGGEQNIWITEQDRKQIKEYSSFVKLDIQTIERSREGLFSVNQASLKKHFEDLRISLKQLEQAIKNTVQKDFV